MHVLRTTYVQNYKLQRHQYNNGKCKKQSITRVFVKEDLHLYFWIYMHLEIKKKIRYINLKYYKLLFMFEFLAGII